MKGYRLLTAGLFFALAAVSATKGIKMSSFKYALGGSKDLDKRLARLSPVSLEASTAGLNENEEKALHKIIEASKLMDEIYLRQVWEGNAALRTALEKDTSALGAKLLHFFNQNVGPWDRLDHGKPFLADTVEKPKQGAFYPADIKKEEFETWVGTLSKNEKKEALGFFSVIQRQADGKLKSIPYSQAYKQYLEPASQLLEEAATLSSDKTLKRFLKERAQAFLSDDYYSSDVAWMELDSKIEPTVGPYETYEDELFGYKAAFEAFVALRNDVETSKLSKFSQELQDIENHLPMDSKYKNPKLGALAPIRVVDLVFSAGEARRGVATAAFNLPNDEKVVKEKGSKRVMLKNVQEAKFEKVLKPITGVVLLKGSRPEVQFEPFFTHILMHELAHGIGPHEIKVGDKATTVRGELKDLYSAIEEAKADITGLFAMQYLMDKGVIDKKMQKSMYTTFLASCFRSVRFGVNEAHGKGIALQFNYLTDAGAFVVNKDGTFSVNFEKAPQAVKSLAGEILTLQAEGSYAKAKTLLDTYAHIRPPMQSLLDKLSGVPVDIEPYYPLAGEKQKVL